MNDAQFNLPEELYARGLAHYRAGEWRAASDMFTQLQALSNAYPEVESLLADAKLKIEIERTEAPEGVLPPKYRTFLRPRFITAVPALVLLGLLLVALRPTVAQSPIGAAVPTPRFRCLHLRRRAHPSQPIRQLLRLPRRQNQASWWCAWPPMRRPPPQSIISS